MKLATKASRPNGWYVFGNLCGRSDTGQRQYLSSYLGLRRTDFFALEIKTADHGLR